MKHTALFCALLAICACGRLTDGFFTGQPAATTGGTPEPSHSPSPSGSTTPAPDSNGSPLPSVNVVCDNSSAFNGGTGAAMYDSAIVPELGAMTIDFSAGVTGTMKLSFGNAKFAPADGVGGGLCFQSYIVSLPFAG